ncbi:MAG: FixH family protein [Burkholderiaceae bacterium]|nr:FixH family protein [Burkholderiaceae bacterium]
MSMNTMDPTSRWYRHRWPWLLAIAPAAALIGGIFTFWLAATTNNAMVVDDYYREGRAINQQLARDRQATALGLQATLSSGGAAAAARSGDAGTTIVARLAAAGNMAWPETLTLRIVHATRAELDLAIVLHHAGGGVYRADGVLPGDGRWLVQIEDPQRTWRLVEAAVTRFDAPLQLRANAP